MIDRRAFQRYGTIALGALITGVVGIPGVKFLLDPLSKRGEGGAFRPLTRLSALVPGVPQAFPIIEARRDAWVKYPREPVGSVWLVRQAEGASPAVVAFTAECPHKGCAVGFVAAERAFSCPCHVARFDLAGNPQNEVAPRPMDGLLVELSGDPDPEVRVKFERFRPMAKERVPLA